MKYVGIALVAALVFGICFLVDKGFTKLFRSKSQHRSGRSVRQVKRYGSFGIILFVLGISSFFVAKTYGKMFYFAGGLLTLLGIAMVVYYMTFGIYYDDETFLVERFGKKAEVYRYSDITAQKLYIAGASFVLELYLTGGKTLQLQAKMVGFQEFMDKAYEAWLSQTGRDPENCDFHDRERFQWFPDASEA